MRKLCERPGCAGPSAVAYGIDNARLTVWFEVALEQDATQAGALCRRHADALVVPKGWTIDDRREPIPRLFIAPDIPTSTKKTDRVSAKNKPDAKRATKRKKSVNTGPSILDTPAMLDTPATPQKAPSLVVVADVADHRTELDETQAIPWMPKLVRRGDYDIDQSNDGSRRDDTASHGRLMRRAFGDRPQN
ncbi:hypothetical protein LBMAG13_05880 [Actinomycetes bacterium]|nr:hypothetical protein LBMAG13_05880 [Actinomycetes bacterium]